MLSGHEKKKHAIGTQNASDDSAATIAASQTQAQCGDASATADCMVQRWQIKPQDAASTLPTYVAYDEAGHPSDIAQLWLRCARKQEGQKHTQTTLFFILSFSRARPGLACRSPPLVPHCCQSQVEPRVRQEKGETSDAVSRFMLGLLTTSKLDLGSRPVEGERCVETTSSAKAGLDGFTCRRTSTRPYLPTTNVEWSGTSKRSYIIPTSLDRRRPTAHSPHSFSSPT